MIHFEGQALRRISYFLCALIIAEMSVLKTVHSWKELMTYDSVIALAGVGAGCFMAWLGKSFDNPVKQWQTPVPGSVPLPPKP